MGRSAVDPKIKAAALSELIAGEQPAIVAERHGLDRELVKKWGQRARPLMSPQVSPVVPARRPTIEAKQEAIGTLILDLLAAKLKASTAIAEAASDPAWLAKQTGTDLAILGEWLDTTAFAIGDRLAGGRRADPTAGDEPAP